MFEDIVFPNERENVRKGEVSGDMSLSREFPLEGQPADRQPEAEDEMRGLGADAWLRLPGFAVGTPNRYDRKDVSVPGVTVADADPFLKGDEKDAMIGGATKPFGRRQAYDMHGDRPGDYQFTEPDGDAREDENFAAEDMDAPIAGPSNPNFPGAGKIGGVPVKKSTKRGTFTGWLKDVTSKRAGFEG